jgi:mannose-6-phosphate isomerase-like protein (cupin superfamily)
MPFRRGPVWTAPNDGCRVRTREATSRTASEGDEPRDLDGRGLPPLSTEGIITIGPEGGEHTERGERYHRILGELPEFEVIELRFGPDFEGVDPHSHDDHIDSFYVLAGEAEFLVGGEVFRAGPGTFVAAPIGVTHGFRNVGESELRMVNIHAPNVAFADRLRIG